MLAAGGIQDILIANQVVGHGKADTGRGAGAEMPPHARRGRRIPGAGALRGPSRDDGQGRRPGRGGHRHGPLRRTRSARGRSKIARAVKAAAGLEFLGVQAYEGHCITVLDPDERRRQVRASMRKAVDTRRLMEASGLPVEVLSGGGTGTYDMTGIMEGLDEVQAALRPDGPLLCQKAARIWTAFSVTTTVISSNGSDDVVLDVGVKGVGAEFGVPVLADRPEEKTPRFESEEHTSVKAWRPAARGRGPRQADPVARLHDLQPAPAHLRRPGRDRRGRLGDRRQRLSGVGHADAGIFGASREHSIRFTFGTLAIE